MAKTNPKLKSRLRRKKHIRKKISGTTERPRLSVFRSARHIYAQIINDVDGTTLASASSLNNSFEDGASGGNKEGAKKIGALIASRAIEKGINTVVFDRNGYLYHGRVKALADSAREAGLKF